MAIEQDTIIFVRRTDQSTVTISNTNPSHRPITIPHGPKIQIDSTKHEWSNYILAGYKGAMEKLSSSLGSLQGFDMLVDGIVPMGSGLSSSSSLVCASALATVQAQLAYMTKKELADLCAISERYVGTQGGGMDQGLNACFQFIFILCFEFLIVSAISFLGEKGKAKRIEFNPLKVFDVQLPSGALFVIANSLAESHKYLTADTCYNKRVVECRLASLVLAKKMNLDWKNCLRLIRVQELSSLSLNQMLQKVEELLHKEPYSLEEIGTILQIDPATMKKNYLGTIQSTHFELYKRAYHVYSESLRVYQFHSTCEKPDFPEQLEQLGTLMNQSHTSCKDLFECSCPELDQLTEICKKAGALGSRLTGEYNNTKL